MRDIASSVEFLTDLSLAIRFFSFISRSSSSWLA